MRANHSIATFQKILSKGRFTNYSQGKLQACSNRPTSPASIAHVAPADSLSPHLANRLCPDQSGPSLAPTLALGWIDLAS